MKSTNAMNCEIIRDLIPLCAEGLCSEESRRAVEAHVQTCEHCRRLYDVGLPHQDEPAAPVPAEGRAMRRVNQKFRRSRLLTFGLGAVLLVLLGGLGCLTAGQIAKRPGMRSFETVFEALAARRFAAKLVSGDIDGYLEELSYGDIDNLYVYADLDEIRAQDKQNLEAAYQAAYGDTRVKRIRADAEYAQFFSMQSSAVCARVTVFYENGKEMELDFYRDVDGLFSCAAAYYAETDPMTGVADEAQAAFQNALNFASHHEIRPIGFPEKLLTYPDPDAPTDDRIRMISRRFAPEYRERVQDSVSAYFGKGLRTENCTLTPPRYDRETGSLYYECTVTGTDGQGSAVLICRIGLNYTGLIPPAPESCRVYQDGCSQKLIDGLSGLLG